MDSQIRRQTVSAAKVFKPQLLCSFNGCLLQQLVRGVCWAVGKRGATVTEGRDISDWTGAEERYTQQQSAGSTSKLRPPHSTLRVRPPGRGRRIPEEATSAEGFPRAIPQRKRKSTQCQQTQLERLTLQEVMPFHRQFSQENLDNDPKNDSGSGLLMHFIVSWGVW